MTRTLTNPELRPYGPGKFDTMLDQYVYEVSLDGGGDASADAGTYHYELRRHGHTIFRDHDPLLESLTPDEQTYLTESAGCIVSEDSQGFVSVEYFDAMEDLDAAWAEIEANEDVDVDAY